MTDIPEASDVDATKFLTNSDQTYVILAIDWSSKKPSDIFVKFNKSQCCLATLNKAINSQFPKGIRETAVQLNLMNDDDVQATCRIFLKSVGLNIKQISTAITQRLAPIPNKNADAERRVNASSENCNELIIKSALL